MTPVVILLFALWLSPAAPAAAQPASAGKPLFDTLCSRCHGADGGGGDMGPPIGLRLSALDDAALRALIVNGRIERGMPPSPVPPGALKRLVAHLRVLQKSAVERTERLSATLVDGGTLEGRVVSQGFSDVQLRTDDGRLHLLRRQGDRFRRVTSSADWPQYNGGPGGNRYTDLRDITRENVSRLSLRWTFSMGGGGALQVTPVVVDGLMYVTAVNECAAIDAGTGREVWRFRRSLTKGVAGGHANRGAVVSGDRLFMVTDHAHLLALDRHSGRVLWEQTMADWKLNYGASSAPLVAGDLVVSGVSGGEHGANGFVIAYDQATGKESWRFRTVPKPGEPGSETWVGSDIANGGAPTWFTGSYDPSLDLVIWPTGNPSKEYNGDDRRGDNLYASCILALDRRTGRLKWHYQFTPHDLWDWDATQTSIVADANWNGVQRQLLLHANRNGFFYVFDRKSGELLLAKAFVKNLNWATGVGADGRPQRVAGREPSPGGTYVCPSQDGATNWFSPSFNPATGLLYVQTFEKCSIYTKRSGDVWTSGKSYLGGTQRGAPDPVPARVLKAIDIATGDIRWELPQPGPAQSWGGTLTTVTGLVFVAEEGGSLLAIDARDGAVLWSFDANQKWKASPMTYGFDGRQHIAIAAGDAILSFALQE
jgi:alcohol dehydrogenase (cytochrome c)